MVRLVALLAATVLLVSTAAAQTAPDEEALRREIESRDGQDVTFYGHIFAFGRGTPMPMNTQFPTGEADFSIGTTTRCGNPPPAPADNEACRALEANEQFWYS